MNQSEFLSALLPRVIATLDLMNDALRAESETTPIGIYDPRSEGHTLPQIYNVTVEMLDRVFEIISREGPNGINHTTLCRRAQFCGGRYNLRDTILDLIDEGSIVMKTTPRANKSTGGRPIRTYYAQ